MPLICQKCGADGQLLTARCPLAVLEAEPFGLDVADYKDRLHQVRKGCLLPVLDHLYQRFAQEDCHDEQAPESINNLLVLGRAHGPWQVPQHESVHVYLRGRPGYVNIHMDYVSPRQDVGNHVNGTVDHVQTHQLCLDVSLLKNSFFSAEAEVHRRPKAPRNERLRSYSLLRLKSSGLREAILSSALAQELQATHTKLEPAWANGGLVCGDVPNPWSFRKFDSHKAVRLFDIMETHNVLIAKKDVSQIEEALRSHLSYKDQPRFEVQDTFLLPQECLSDAMQSFSMALIDGQDLGSKYFNTLIHDRCKNKDNQSAHG